MILLRSLILLILGLFSTTAISSPTLPISPLHLNDEPLSKRTLSITDALIADLAFFSQYAAATYCNSAAPPNSPIACSASACPDVVAHNATVVASFTGETTGMGGFVAVDPARQAIVVAFKGSNSLRNWLANVLFGLSPCTNLAKNCKVHTGFQAAWAEISPAVLSALKSARAAHPTYSVIATGHSLGGAVANLFAATVRASSSSSPLPVTVYTYGSPRLGNDALVNFIDAQTATGNLGKEYRVTHVGDPVPNLPPLLFGYRHTSPELWLSAGSATTTSYKAKDVKVCEGTANLKCNAGVLGFDVDAHGYYFRDVGACDGGFTWKRDATDDEVLAEMVAHWQEMDRLYVEALGGGGE
jgi:hypothetical protein